MTPSFRDNLDGAAIVAGNTIFDAQNFGEGQGRVVNAVWRVSWADPIAVSMIDFPCENGVGL
jgi:glutamine cyclotransferase